MLTQARVRGATTLELTFVAPGLLLLVFLAVQTGLYYYGGTVAEQATREGVADLRLAQTGAVAADVDTRVQAAVEAYAAVVGRETLLAPRATTTYDEDTGKVSVTVRGRVLDLVPGLDLTVTQRAYGEVERFEGDAP